jgi:hypothetical protein
MKHLRFLNPLCLLGLVSSILLAGCNFSPLLPSTGRIANSKVENPFFNIPPMNHKDYKDRHWILLAESTENNWFYDPYSLNEDEEGIVTFDTFFTPRKILPGLNRFNATITGPFLQKIDCFSNHQWSEIFYADKMPAQETFVNSKNPKLEYGWIKIKPKTAMAYVRTRVCGRKFLDDKNVNYFLFQEGQMKVVKVNPPEKKTPPTPGELMVAEFTKLNQPEEIQTSVSSSAQSFPVFYEVINNTVTVIDQKKDIREMRVSSYELNKEFPKLADYVFRAHCQNKIYSFSVQGKLSPLQELADSPESLPNVAFNRVCGDHGDYMKSSSSKRRK